MDLNNCNILTIIYIVTQGLVNCEIPSKPNIIVILLDDLGYADIQTYGHPSQEYNEIDRMAEEGMSLRQFYAADSVCSPSRAALLTGRLPARIGIHSESGSVRLFRVTHTTGLPLHEVTIPEILKMKNYTSGMVGKWHLGINRWNSSDGYYLPSQHGFDWVGLNLPYSNVLKCEETFFHSDEGPAPQSCFLYQGDNIIQQPFSYSNMTLRMVDEMESFIHNNSDTPFFLMYNPLQMHIAQFADPPFDGSSRRGIYGDVLNELAWSVGRILDALVDAGIDKNTLVLLTSDNGPNFQMCLEGGDAGALQGGKGLFSEGGIRVPMIAWMPGHIKPGISMELATQMDFLPTIAELAGIDMPDNLVLDGKSIVPLLFGDGTSPHEIILHYCGMFLFAARKGPFKIVYRSNTVVFRDYLACSCPNGYKIGGTCQDEFSYDCNGDNTEVHSPPLIYNIQRDPREMFALTVSQYSNILDEVNKHISEFESTFEKGEPLLDAVKDCKVIPCCDTDVDNCVCNYAGDTFMEGNCF